MRTPDERIGANVAEVRRARRISVRQLAERMTEQGLKIHPSALTSLEQGKRRATAAEVLGFALILGVNPNRLLMPERADDTWTQLTPKVAVPAGAAWYWADGSLPVLTDQDKDRSPAEVAMEFRQSTRPIEWQVRAEHPAWRAVVQLKTRVELLLDRLRPDAKADTLGVAGAATDTDRSLKRVNSEVGDLIREHKTRQPAFIQIVREDGFTGDVEGVPFKHGVAMLRETDVRAPLFTGPGYITHIIPAEVVDQAALPGQQTFTNWLYENPASPEGTFDNGER